MLYKEEEEKYRINACTYAGVGCDGVEVRGVGRDTSIGWRLLEASFNADIVPFASLYSDTLFAHNFRLVIFLDFRNRAGHARRLRHFDFTLRKTWN